MASLNISSSKDKSGIVKTPDFIIILFFLCGTLFLNSCIKDPTIPILKTISATDITINSVTIGGEITNNGGSPVTSRGICWGTAVKPSFEGPHIIDGEGDGIFSTSLTDLNPNTEYHARAFAENSVGIAYGNEIVFVTSTAAPAVTTVQVSNITASTAVCGGNVTYEGGVSITGRGVCWSTTPGPDLNDFFTSDGTGSASFSSAMINLAPATTYYVRAYAKNSAWIVYGEELTFNTKIADIEGNLYRTVTIGAQVWMAENLLTTKYNDNTLIPNVTDNAQWSNLITPAYCWYANDISLKPIYGALYNWFTINTGKLCPTGWHVPTDLEYNTLEIYLGISPDQIDIWGWRGTNQGTQMKSTTSWDNGGNGTNSSGFTGLAGGYRQGAYGDFYAIGMLTYWWTTTDDSANGKPEVAWYRRLDGSNSDIYKATTLKKGGKYVRCLKD